MRLLSAVLLMVLMAAPAGAEPPRRTHLVLTDNPLATAAGMSALADGGTAADAAIAAQLVLALVEPQSSGLGGGAVAVSVNAGTGSVLSWDGRETAPAAARPDLFMRRDGTTIDFAEAGRGGRAVGVPGMLRMLEALHRSQGKLPWDRLFVHAIRLAETGFPVSTSLAAAIVADADRLKQDKAAAALYFSADGVPAGAGSFLTNRTLGETLRAVASGGADALYRGAIAGTIAMVVRGDANVGLLTSDDMAAYVARGQPALCGLYRGQRVCGIGPPSAGGLSVLQILGLLQHFDLSDNQTDGTEARHLLAEAERLTAADRALYLADDTFQRVPVAGLLDPAYLTIRAQLIDPEQDMGTVHAGNPSWGDVGLAPALPQPEHGTSQVTAIDDAGNAVSLTATLQDSFGSGLMARGMMLNDSLTDFAFVPERGDRAVANRVAGGKRPLTSMSPMLVFASDGALRLAAGATGGARIVDRMARLLVRSIDGGLSPAKAAGPGVQAIAVTPQGLAASTD
jgi:gamma-glutamyltranspeptidase/glutathione hydrolase